MPTKTRKSKPKRGPHAKRKSKSWRASWKGELRLGLVRFSVEAINAHSRAGGDVHFHQLHAQCHSRIEYHKVCPIHGEVDQDEIVMGYEYARGKYVEVDPDELDELRTSAERALTIEEFIPADELDPIYYDGRMYYLAPDGANDREPYHLLRQALETRGQMGIGQVVFSGKEQLAAVWPRGNVLVMAMLNYEPELRNAAALGVGEDTKISSTNLHLAKELIASMESDSFDLAAYEDRYQNRVKELIAAKKKGEEVVTPPEEEEGDVINLMDALKRSLGEKQARRGRKRTRKRGA
jgi:DNA end-binding protein Ku